MVLAVARSMRSVAPTSRHKVPTFCKMRVVSVITLQSVLVTWDLGSNLYANIVFLNALWGVEKALE